MESNNSKLIYSSGNWNIHKDLHTFMLLPINSYENNPFQLSPQTIQLYINTT